MRILGVSGDYHDSAAAVVIDGVVVAAAEEERFSRVKHDDSLPDQAIASCLATAGLEGGDIDVVVFHEKPLVVVSRVLAARQRRGPRGVPGFVRDFPVLLRRNLMVGYRIDRRLRALGARRSPKIVFSEHHLSHAAAAFLPSPFDTAAVLTVDGIGEWATGAVGHGLRHRIDLLEEQRFPNSLGLLYSLATVWCGFEANDGEYKVMGLAPFGEPRYAAALAELVQVHDDGSVTVDAKRANWWAGDPARMSRLVAALDGPPRRADEPLTAREWDLARSVQDLVELAMVRMAAHAHELTGERNLCLAGGVALNCVANGRLLREGPFDEIWVQPAPGDSGSAVGAALWYWHDQLSNPRTLDTPDPATALRPDAMSGAALGPSFTTEEVGSWLEGEGVAHERVSDRAARCERVAERLASGAVVGWVEGRVEVGPRALGHRSILADPRSVDVQRDLNVRVKGRESFRPFAPAVLWERASEWFEIDAPSPYMLFTFDVAESKRLAAGPEPTDPVERVQVARSQIPACTHVDNSARVQTVHTETAPAFHALLAAFESRTGCPVLLNTSFNLAGEPIVCTPDQALDTARRAGLDLLVIDEFLVDLPGHRDGALK